MNLSHDIISPFELTRKRPFDLDEHGVKYSSPTVFKRLNANKNYDFSRSYDSSFPQGFQEQPSENSIHGPLFGRIYPNHEFSRESVAISPQFQNPSHDFSGGNDIVSSQFNDPSRNLSTRYERWREGEADTRGFKARRNKNRKRGHTVKNPTCDYSRSDFGSYRFLARGGKVLNERPNSKIIPTCHITRECDSISPRSQVRASDNPRVTIGKVNPKRDFSRKTNSNRTSEKPKEGSFAKVNTSRDFSRKIDLILSKNQVKTSEEHRERSIVKVNPKCDSVSPRFQAKASENPKEGSIPLLTKCDNMLSAKALPEVSDNLKDVLPVKINPTRGFKKKCDVDSPRIEIKVSENSKESLVGKVNPSNDSSRKCVGFCSPVQEKTSESPDEAKVSKVLVTSVIKLEPTKSRDNFKIRKVNAFRQFPKKFWTLATRITKGCNDENLVSIKRDSMKASEVSSSGVLKSDSTTSKVVNDYIESTVLKTVSENIKGIEPLLKSDDVEVVVNELKIDAVEEVLKENLMPNEIEKELKGPILSNDVDKVCTDPISRHASKKIACVRSVSKYPPPRKGFSAIRDFPLKFRTQKAQAFGPKDDVPLIGEQSQSGAGLEPNLEENALEEKVYEAESECTQLSADKKEMKNSHIHPLAIESSPFEKHHENVCSKFDVDMIDAAYMCESDLMPNQEKNEASIIPFVDTNAENHEHFNDLSIVSSDQCVAVSNHNRFNNLSIVFFGDCKTVSNGKQVKEVLDSYEQVLEKLLEDNKAAEFSGKGKVSKQVHIEAAMLLKKEKQWVNTEPILGHVPGVEVGDRFRFRAELVCIGLHRNFQNGIDYIKETNGKTLAASIVSSGRYENDEEFPDVLHYCGQGGNPKSGRKTRRQDQQLVKGNLALKNSMEAKTPVRVIRKNNNSVFKYYYDGLYTVSKVTQETSQYGNLIYIFQLNRIISSETNSTPVEKLRFLVEDISLGKEKIPIRVFNPIDDEKFPSFKYITHMQYPDSCYREMCGCDCTDGCSDITKCQCVIKNGGEVFDANGSIVIGPKSKRFIYECGSSCMCPPSCKTRVSQYGIRFQLEIFKTKSMGWGVRSRNYIPAGSFICEYVGELLQDQEAEQRSNNDEYLFDIDHGYTIDAAEYGNVGRFINHSCSPNLYAQNVLFDHDNKRMPHVMFFAVNGIFPFLELTYDYNYKVNSVRDDEGNIKKKACHCGSRCCTGRLY